MSESEDRIQQALAAHLEHAELEHHDQAIFRDENVAEGDFRGPYGFGRPAHRLDPAASHILSPNEFVPSD